MKIIEGSEQFRPAAKGVVLTIGNFDGMHLGHRLLIETALTQSREKKLPVVAMTFEPHPLAIVAPERAPAQLTTLAEKLQLLEACGVDTTIVLRSTRELLDKTAEQFLFDLVEHCRPRVIVEGPSFNFGRARGGSAKTLIQNAAIYNYGVIIVEEYHGQDILGKPAINSSAIRRAIRDARLSDAAAMLGRPHRIAGKVVTGKQRGASLNYPTANLNVVPQLLPHEAVYAAVAQLADDSLYLAAVNVGPQPTFGQARSCIEAHLLDFTGQLRGQLLGLHLLAKLRDQVRFDSVARLQQQLEADVTQTRRFNDQLESIRANSPLKLHAIPK